MKILVLILTGLGSNSFENATGMRNLYGEYSEHATYAGHSCELAHFDWHPDGDSSPDAVCRAMLAACQVEKADRIIVLDHSFGAALFLFFAQWLVRWHPGAIRIGLSVTFDLAVNAGQFGDGELINVAAAYGDNSQRPYIPQTSVEKVLAFFQRGGRPAGVCGCPVFEREGVENVEVTDWVDEDGKPLDHSSMISAPRVVDKALAAMLQTTSAPPAPITTASVLVPGIGGGK